MRTYSELTSHSLKTRTVGRGLSSITQGEIENYRVESKR